METLGLHMLIPNPSTLMRMVVAAPIRFYQHAISPALGPRCRYSPSCSSYALQAIHTHGALKGIVLGIWRILRCNPWSRGGVDHVPDKGRWTPDPWIPPEDWVGNAIIERPLPMGMSPNTESKDSINLEDEARQVSIRSHSVHHPIDEAHSPDLVAENHPAKAGQSKDATGVRSS